MQYRAYKYRLWPSADQAVQLDRCFAVLRWIYNAALEQRRTYGRRKGADAFGRDSSFTAPRQSKELNYRSRLGRPGLLDDPDLRWLTELPRECVDAVLRDLDKAFDGFFAGRGGYPSSTTDCPSAAASLETGTDCGQRFNQRWWLPSPTPHP